MVMEAIDKILFFIFFLTSMHVIRTGYFLVQSWISRERYTMKPINLLFLGASIAYILTCVFTGIKL
jgi:hypothetical protein